MLNNERAKNPQPQSLGLGHIFGHTANQAGVGLGSGASCTGWVGSNIAAKRPSTANTASTIRVSAYPSFPSTRLDTMTVPAMATPNEEPRFETLRDRPDISP